MGLELFFAFEDFSDVFLYELSFADVFSTNNKCKAFVMNDSSDGFGVEEAHEESIEFKVAVPGELDSFSFGYGGRLVSEKAGLLFVDGVDLVNNFFPRISNEAFEVFHLEAVNCDERVLVVSK